MEDRERHLSLSQILLVIAILAIVFYAVFVPNLTNGGRNARETKALEALSAYAKIQAIYQHKFKRYGTLVELRDQGYMDNHPCELPKGNPLQHRVLQRTRHYALRRSS